MRDGQLTCPEHKNECGRIPIMPASAALDLTGESGTHPAYSPWQRYNRQIGIFALFFLSYLAAALLWQWVSGIGQSELSHLPDEAAHVTTSLMIRDYLAGHFPASPLKYGEMYYMHYPKIGFGMWPPLFHIVAAIWMLLFGATRLALLALMAVQCAVLATTLALFTRRFLPGVAAFGAGLLLVSLPLIQVVTTTVMVDILVATLELWATLFLIRYFETENKSPAIWFGVTTALALLTKANANALVLAPVLLLLLTRKFYLLRRAPLYIAAAIVLLLGIPWQLVSMHMLQATVPMAKISASFVASTFSLYLHTIYLRLGTALLAFVAIGIAVEAWPLVLRGTGDSRRTIGIAGMFSLLAAVFLFHSFVPTPADERYMTTAMPALIFFFALGIGFVAAAIPVPRLPVAARATLLAGTAVMVFARTTFAIPPRPGLGFSEAARVVASPSNQFILVCSDSVGEGAFITSVALTEPRPKRFILRGSKTLSDNAWFLTEYRPVFDNAATLQQYLENTVDAVVIDLSSTLWEQDRTLLLQSLQQNPQKWMLLTTIPQTAQSRNLLVYQRTGPAPHNRNISVQMKRTLGRDLVHTP